MQASNGGACNPACDYYASSCSPQSQSALLAALKMVMQRLQTRLGLQHTTTWPVHHPDLHLDHLKQSCKRESSAHRSRATC